MCQCTTSATKVFILADGAVQPCRSRVFNWGAIFTNLEFSQWTQLFENEMMVAALVDRVTFNSQILNMNCTTSYRMETALNARQPRRT